MNFLKANEKLILIGIVAVVLGFTGLRMVVSFTLEPGQEPSAVADLLGVQAPPVKERQALAPQDISWSFEGFTGKYDMPSVRRGLQVYREVCSACHGLEQVAFRNLTEIGYSEDAAKEIAASYQIADIDDFGDATTRPGAMTDHFPSPFPNDVAAAVANGGKVPPDLSLMTKARVNGPDYVYSLLMGYVDPPADFVPNSNTTTYNPYFEGWEIGMAGPLFEGSVEYADGTEASLEQMSLDVTNFLMWTAEPKLEARHSLGIRVLLFTLFMTIIFFLSMKKVWARVKK